MRSGRDDSGKKRPPNAEKSNRPDSNRSPGFRLNPRRQMLFVVLALAGVAAGYGFGYLFNSQAPQPGASEAEAVKQRPVSPAAPTARAVAALPILPEGAKPAGQTPLRAYEEALPKTVIENHAAVDAANGKIPPKSEPTSAAENPVVPATADHGGPAPTPAAAGPASEIKNAADAPRPAPEVAALPPATTPSISAPPTPAPQWAPPLETRDRETLPAWRQFAVAVPAAAGRPRIAIVIDDLGIDKPRTQRAIRLHGPLTLSFLTYASGLKEMTAAARSGGHELLMHVPMEPGSPDIDPGPNVLLTGIPQPELIASLQWNLDQFDGYVGINNHMGSRFTADLPGMTTVMEELKRRNLLFLDSITAGNSVAGRAARRVGVPYARRNVFIDHEDNIDTIKKQLAQVERLATRTGVAVAIGHPREATLTALGPWLTEVEARGFQLVPISAVIDARPSSRG